MKNSTRLIDEMRTRQSELQLAVNRKQEDLAETMTELAAVTRAVRAYDDVINPPKKRPKAPLMITGPIAAPEPVVPAKPRRNRTPSASAQAAGGRARAAAMTTEQRQEAGRRGAAVRWANAKRRAGEATP